MSLKAESSAGAIGGGPRLGDEVGGGRREASAALLERQCGASNDAVAVHEITRVLHQHSTEPDTLD
jgi:hypothetical protein